MPKPKLPAPESSGRVRHLYVIEILLGVALVTLIAVVFWSNTTTNKPVDSGKHSENIVELTTANWQKEVIESKVPVVVDFWAPWCGPCLQIAPTIDKLADEYAGKVKFAKLNVDKAPEIAERYKAPPIPMVCVFQGSEEPKAKFVGAYPDLENKIVAALRNLTR